MGRHEPGDPVSNPLLPESVDVAVVIVTHNSAKVIEGLLDSLPHGLRGLTSDITVVDNASSDQTRRIVRQRNECRLVESANVGYAAAINVGVKNSQAAHAILILNPDTVLHEGAAASLHSALNEPCVGIAAPMMLDASGELLFSQRREPTLLRACGLSRTNSTAFSEQVSAAEAYKKRNITDWAVGAALMVSRVCYEAVGGWDASYFLYSEETDFCLRARDFGYLTLYEPTAVVSHDAGGSGRSAWTHSMQVINRVRLYRRRHGAVTSAAYFGLILANEVTRIPRGGGSHSRRAVRDLIRPSLRPPEMNAAMSVIPR